MTAPITIYLQWYDDDEPGGEGITWCVDKIEDEDVEYIRIDIYEALQRENAELHTKLADARKGYDALMADSVGR
jgi:hypothetical protein